MDDLKFGKRNKRGDFSPSTPLQVAPIIVWPPRPLKLLAWLPHYILPWNALFMGFAAVIWFYLTPSKESLQTLHWTWIAFILLRNAALVFLFYGALELRLYIRRAQGNRFKFNGLFPADKKSDVFMFKSQNIDNILRSFGTGVPIWTAYEVGMLYAWAHGFGPWTTFEAHPWALIALLAIIPLFHEAHFFCIHRLIHTPFLYKWVHSVHHNSVNPSPWSSLSMHPVEHLLYWSDILIHLVLPSHPLLMLYHLQVTGTGAVVGHIGFDKIEAGEAAMDSHAYAHYLHHKYFEVNYSDGMVPFDQWFGTWHDGSAEGEARMEARFQRTRAKANAKVNNANSTTGR
ncbi:sterol desaturase family protein [Cypionkella sp.]|uniref:sterol desaturase family protein n=1 Tax=Cypionkella sp. TaxID=2811411 RepID=UPI002AC948DC|nr:sterol desaturase family protein [Cypionkella sp.]